jgi:hypothetical protein
VPIFTGNSSVSILLNTSFRRALSQPKRPLLFRTRKQNKLGRKAVHFDSWFVFKMAQTVDKQIEKLRATVESGAAYEAQQILKTVFHRYRSRKKLQDSYDLVERGAILQLQHGQVGGVSAQTNVGDTACLFE